MFEVRGNKGKAAPWIYCIGNVLMIFFKKLFAPLWANIPV